MRLHRHALPLALFLVGCSANSGTGPGFQQGAGSTSKCTWNITAPVALAGNTSMTVGSSCTVAPPPADQILTVGLYVPVKNTFDGDAGVSDMAIVENDLFQVGIDLNAYAGRQGISEMAGAVLPLGISGHNPLDFSYTAAGTSGTGVENVTCDSWMGTLTIDSLEPMWQLHFDAMCTTTAGLSLTGAINGCQDGDGGAC